MNNWVRFHAQLCQGEHLGEPRAWRFVYMELSLMARERRGYIPLPFGKTGVEGVKRLLAGDQKEVADAVKHYSSLADPSLSFGEVSGKPVVFVTNWEKWNPKSDDSAPRVARKREEDARRALEAETAKSNGTDPVTETVTVTVTETEEKRGVTPRARALLSSPLLSVSSPSGSPMSTGRSRSPRKTPADVQAWCDGVSSVTGAPCGAPTGGALKYWIEARSRHCPPDVDQVAWARAKGAAYAKSRPGDVSAFRFGNWLDGGSKGLYGADAAEPTYRKVEREHRRDGCVWDSWWDDSGPKSRLVKEVKVRGPLEKSE